MHKNPLKFENVSRIKELDIVNSLQRAGLSEGQVVCDYGAGTGIVTAQVAQITSGKVYAFDMNPSMIELIQEKVETNKHSNVAVVKVGADQIPLEDGVVDLFLLVTVLHEIEDVPDFVSEVNRVLKPGGKVMVIDFYKKETPMGPPLDHRMSAYQGARHFFREGIILEEQYALGENFYQLVLKKP